MHVSKGYYVFERFMMSVDTVLLELKGDVEEYTCAAVGIVDGLIDVMLANWNFLVNEEDEEPDDFTILEFDTLKDAKDSPYYPFLMEAAKMLLRNIDPDYGKDLKQMIEEAEA